MTETSTPTRLTDWYMQISENYNKEKEKISPQALSIIYLKSKYGKKKLSEYVSLNDKTLETFLNK